MENMTQGAFDRTFQFRDGDHRAYSPAELRDGGVRRSARLDDSETRARAIGQGWIGSTTGAGGAELIIDGDKTPLIEIVIG